MQLDAKHIIHCEHGENTLQMNHFCPKNVMYNKYDST
jgi:hypothetical protein